MRRDYGWAYNSTGTRCTGKPQPGTVALRNVIIALYPGIGSYGIYNCRQTRTGSSLSTHAEGRGWDASCNAYNAKARAVGDRLAADLWANARALGIQRIIWNRRQIDSRPGNRDAWRAYRSYPPHTDHLHIELCWAAARDIPLTESYIRSVLPGMKQEDDLAQVPQNEWEQAKRDIEDIKKALYIGRGKDDPLYPEPIQIDDYLREFRKEVQAALAELKAKG